MGSIPQRHGEVAGVFKVGPGDTCTSSIAQGQGAKSEAEPCPTSGWNQAPTWMCGSPSTLVIVFGGTMGQCG